MNKQQQLETLFSLWSHMTGVPNEMRSQNYTSYISELQQSIYILAEELGYDKKEWDTSDNKYKNLKL